MIKKYIEYPDSRISAICYIKSKIVYFNVNAKKNAKLIYIKQGN